MCCFVFYIVVTHNKRSWFDSYNENECKSRKSCIHSINKIIDLYHHSRKDMTLSDKILELFALLLVCSSEPVGTLHRIGTFVHAI